MATVIATATSLDSPSLYLNRELSWLAFNERVLAQAWDPEHPLLERVRFLAIVGSNLDEFFMIRIAVLQKQLRTERDRISFDGLTTVEQLTQARARALRLREEQARCWSEELRPQLAAAGIRILDQADYPEGAAEYLAGYFRREIAPVLTPLAFDPGHPFPHISNLSKNLAMVVKHDGRTKFARVKIPPVIPRFIPLPAALAAPTTFVFLEDVVCANAQHLFPGNAGARLVCVPDHPGHRHGYPGGRGGRPARNRRSGVAAAAARRAVDARSREPHATARRRHPGRELRDRRRRTGANGHTGSASATGPN